MQKIKCHLIVRSKIGHLNQIYAGFIELYKKGIIELTIDKEIVNTKPLVEVIINDLYRVIYDTYDQGDKYYENIDNKIIDFYFKRSFDKENIINKFEKIEPLGLNYNVYSKRGNIFSEKDKVINLVKILFKRKGANFSIEKFETEPSVSKEPKICFLTRVWDPYANEVENKNIREERIAINKFRVECIRACKKKYGINFIGGIENSEYARKLCPDCIVNSNLSNRKSFINILKTCEICIATSGLHKSMGWKLGEYVATARAIISERLYYQLPGNFEEKVNYLEFSTVKQLIECIDSLINNEELRYKIMLNNKEYYYNYVRPDKMIMNTLEKVFDGKILRREGNA